MIRITEGLAGHMVLQRNKKNKSYTEFEIESNVSGPVKMRVKNEALRAKSPEFLKRNPRVSLHPRLKSRGFEALWDKKSGGWIKLGNAVSGKFRGRIESLKTGGPYDIEISVGDGRGAENLIVRDVLVGDVWLLAGQSNMEGIGHLKDACKPHPMVRAFYMDNRWAVAKDPIHNISKAVAQVHADISGGVLPVRAEYVGVGPGVAFGKEMQKITGVPQGLISCGHGGTSMAQWDPSLKNLVDKSLYGAMLSRFRRNGSNVAGLVWYQGCSDTLENAPVSYTERMINFIASVRGDCNNANLPIAMVQIARVCSVWDEKGWNSIQEQQRLLPEKVSNLSIVPAIDLELDDAIHISGKSQHILGKRLACAMSVLIYGKKAGKPPIVLKSVEITKSIDKLCSDIIVTYGNVIGKLKSQGRPEGFEIIVDGKKAIYIYCVDLSENKVILKTSIPLKEATGKSLHYGYGTNPYCNITDEAGRSVPVFGPFPLPEPQV